MAPRPPRAAPIMRPRLVDLCGGWVPVSIDELVGGVCVLEDVADVTEVVFDNRGKIWKFDESCNSRLSLWVKKKVRWLEGFTGRKR